MHNFASLLTEARHQSGETQVQLAARAGVSVPTVRSIETGGGTSGSLLQIVNALGQRLAWTAFDGTGHPGSALKARRKRLGISQRKLARRAGVSAPTILTLERDFVGRINTLERVFQVLRLVPQLRAVETGPSGSCLFHHLPDEVARLLTSDFSDDPSPPAVFMVGDASDALSALPGASIDCAITSPPYFGLRVYSSGGIGNEASVERYIDSLMAVFRQVHRVLRPEGSFWLNLGDTYRDKKLLGVPWRVALGLANDGWIIRNSVVWSKRRGGMDRATNRLPNRHEMIFHFVKGTSYFYDPDAIRQPARPARRVGDQWVTASGITRATYADQIAASSDLSEAEKAHAISALDRVFEKIARGELHDFRMILRGTHRATHSDNTSYSSRAKSLEQAGFYILEYDPRGSLPSDVWDIAPVGSRGRENHFAAYPPELCRIPILATCPRGGVVIDPFCGTGSTNLAAQQLGRASIGVDISEQYIGMARRRCS